MIALLDLNTVNALLISIRILAVVGAVVFAVYLWTKYRRDRRVRHVYIAIPFLILGGLTVGSYEAEVWYHRYRFYQLLNLHEVTEPIRFLEPSCEVADFEWIGEFKRLLNSADSLPVPYSNYSRTWRFEMGGEEYLLHKDAESQEDYYIYFADRGNLVAFLHVRIAELDELLREADLYE